MKRVYNFSAGPSVLPEAVLRRAADEMLDYQGSGQSVMEMSHRSKTFDAIIKNTEALLRELMEIPEYRRKFYLWRKQQYLLHHNELPLFVLLCPIYL